MPVSDRDRRALLLLGVGFVLFLLLQTDWILPAPGASASDLGSVEAEQNKLLLAQTQVRQEPLLSAEYRSLKSLEESLEDRLLESETAALAQAEMRERVGELLEGAGISMRASRFTNVKAEGEDFAQVPLIVDFTCDVTRFVNLLADIANAQEILSTREVKVSSASPKTKAVRVELTISGYLPITSTPELIKKPQNRS
ncbi:MAG: type II secretion system protein GspM [Bryobacterales bacterium]|nr:type II secretion system protein GspM [Bryobacterales bacterium]